MKNLQYYTCILVALLFTLCATSALAADLSWSTNSATTSTSGSTLVDSSNAKFTISLSPSCQFGYTTDGTGTTYAVKTNNTAPTLGDRNTYGFASDYSGYYKQPTTSNDDTTWAAPTAADKSAFGSGWTNSTGVTGS